jgi:transposase InsO family protein
MKIHANARTTIKTRALLVDQVIRQGKTKAETARAFGTSPRTVAKWIARYQHEGPKGLRDRSSAPHRIPHRTSEARTRRIAKLRHKGLCAWQIAKRLCMAISTVTSVLRRLGLGRGWNRKRPEVIRYEWPDPGDLLHVDIKKLGRFRQVGHRITGQPTDHSRGMGWEFVYVCVDDASRLAYVEILENEQAVTAMGFLERALLWFRKQEIRVRRVMTDNGSPFVSKRWAQLCKKQKLRHIRTRPYTPRTNGKAERFIQTLQREWAYGKPYQTSAGRRRALPAWLRYYNEQRPHRALGMRSPKARLRRAG